MQRERRQISHFMNRLHCWQASRWVRASLRSMWITTAMRFRPAAGRAERCRSSVGRGRDDVLPVRRDVEPSQASLVTATCDLAVARRWPDRTGPPRASRSRPCRLRAHGTIATCGTAPRSTCNAPAVAAADTTANRTRVRMTRLILCLRVCPRPAMVESVQLARVPRSAKVGIG